MLAALSVALAQSGGGFGGSAPSSPPSGSGGGYGGGGYGSGWGGGGGFPSFGFFPVVGGGGGGGLFGILIVVVFVLIAMSALRRSTAGIGGGRAVRGDARAVKVQLLLSEGDMVKRDLQRVAAQGETGSAAGLTRMLNEAALSVLRHPERWSYGFLEQTAGDPQSAGAQVGAWATEARSAFTDQTTANYGGFQQGSPRLSKREEGGVYLAVTIAVAAYRLAPLGNGSGSSVDAEALRQALFALAGVQPGELIRMEVAWSPDVEGEFLTEDQALLKYPRLHPL